jgi:hypothetical protein
MQLGGALQHLWILPRRLGLRRREEAGSIRKSSSSHVPGAKPGTTNPALSVNDIKDEPGFESRTLKKKSETFARL